jgi:hypothetical protein
VPAVLEHAGDGPRLVLPFFEAEVEILGGWQGTVETPAISPIHRSAWKRNSANFALTEF